VIGGPLDERAGPEGAVSPIGAGQAVIGLALVAALAGAALLLVAAGQFGAVAVTASHPIFVDGHRLDIEIADRVLLREKGLSGRTALAEGRGMLFVYGRDGRWGIWMKDMAFPIDVVWADGSGTIVAMKESLSPQTYPTVFYPDVPARYVLEAPAGFAAANRIGAGSRIVQ